MRILVHSPMRRIDDVEAHREVLRWVRLTKGKHDVDFAIDTPFGVDLARSLGIQTALDGGYERLVCADSDVTPGCTFQDAMSFATQAFSRGYAMILSPTPTHDGKLQVWPLPGTYKDDHYTSPYDVPSGLSEIGWGALGLAVIDGSALPKLKVLDRQLTINGDPKGTPLYCVYSAKVGEDKSLCDNVRESTGKKVGCETRLVADHWKMKKNRSWPGAELARAIISRERSRQEAEATRIIGE